MYIQNKQLWRIRNFMICHICLIYLYNFLFTLQILTKAAKVAFPHIISTTYSPIYLVLKNRDDYNNK